jgi:DNA-binding winged helix-turn-helix (wHTH) protein
MLISIDEHIRIDREQRIVRIDEQEVRLTALEFGLLDYLVSHPNRICSRDELIDHVWGKKFQYDPGTIDVHLNALRRKLGFSKTRPIETIRGAGLVYRIEEQVAHYTIDLQTFAGEWIRTHEVELQTHGLIPSLHLTPFVNEITIDPRALSNMLDAVLAALLPSAQPGHLKLSSKLTMQFFVLALEINGTTNELKIPIA